MTATDDTPEAATEDGPEARTEAAPAAGDDADLLAVALDGDMGAFRELFHRKHRLVYLAAYQILGNVATAEDVVQDTFLTLWEKGRDYDPRYALDTWLRRIATNRAIDLWRRRGTVSSGARDERPGGGSGSGSSSGASPQLSEAWERLGWQEVQRIWDELAAPLPPMQRAAFYLCEIEELDTAEVAAILECAPSTVRSHLSLARKALRQSLAERYPEYAPAGAS